MHLRYHEDHSSSVRIHPAAHRSYEHEQYCGHVVELFFAFVLGFSRCLLRGPDRHGRHGFRADLEHRSRRVGRDCQAGRVFFCRRELSLFMFLEFMVRSTLPYQKIKIFRKSFLASLFVHVFNSFEVTNSFLYFS